MISFGLDDEQELLRDTARRFAAEVVRPAARSWERAGEVPHDARRACFELGLGLVDVPEALGGLGAGALAACVALEELATGDPAASVSLQASQLVPRALIELGATEQAGRLLAPFLSDALALGAVAWSEPPSSTAPLAGFATQARRAERAGVAGWELSGRKAFVVNGGRARVTIVCAQVEGAGDGWGGASAFAIDGQEVEGLVSGERHALLGLDAAYVGQLELDRVFVPQRNRLDGAVGFVAGATRLMAFAALQSAARQVGLARAAYECALGYTQERKAFGKTIAHFQSIAFQLADMATDVDAARWMTWRAAIALDASEADAPMRAGQAAAHAHELAWRTADWCVQLLGGAGFIQDFLAEKWLRDTKVLALCGPGAAHAAGAWADAALGGNPDEALPCASIQSVIL